MIRRAATRLLAICLLVWAMVGNAAAKDRVWVALSGEEGVYAETATVLRGELGSDVLVSSGMPENLLDANQPPPALIVTVGTAAFDQTLKWLGERYAVWGHVPVLATLLPRSAYEARLAAEVGRSRMISAVLLDQPIARQMALVRRALPNWTRVAILNGPQTRPQLPVLERQARSRDLRLVASTTIDASEQIYPALREVLESADVLLALPDPLIYNGNSLQNILLATYRARVPVVAFSAAYVKAGALLAVFTTPSQVARHSAGVVRGWLKGRSLPPAQAPREFEVVVNAHVANSLGFRLDEATRIADDLRRLEGSQ